MNTNPIQYNDEHWLENLRGLSLNKRIENAIHKQARKETLAYLIDRWNRGKPAQNRMHETVFVAIMNKHKILDIGINKPNDIILDTFGTWLAGLIRTPVNSITSVSLTDITAASRTVSTYGAGGTSLFNNQNAVIGTQLQVGSGTTTPARGNTAIETAFGTAPENTQFGTGNGSYSTGFVNFASSITAGGSGTVNETGFFGRWAYPTTQATFMLFHDKLSTGKAFVAGNTILVSYSIAL